MLVNWISEQELKERLNLRYEDFHQAMNEGMPHKIYDGKPVFDLKAVQRWFEHGWFDNLSKCNKMQKISRLKGAFGHVS